VSKLILSILAHSRLLESLPAAAGGHADSLLLEDGSYLLLETSDTLLLE